MLTSARTWCVRSLAGPSAVLQKASEQVVECLRRAAESEACADIANDPNSKADYQKSADAWRTLAYGYEFQEALSRFISYNESAKRTIPFASPASREPTLSALPANAAQAVELASRNDAETVLRSTPFLVTRCSSDLRYLFVSEACARMLGHRPEELIGKKIAEVIGESAFQTILPHVNAVLAGQRVEYEAEVPYKDIGPRFVHVTYAPDEDGSGHVRGWVASIIDITEKRQAEQRIAADLRAMTLLGEVGSECGRDGATMDRCLHQILDAAIIIAGAQKGNIQLPDPSSGLLQIAAQRGFKKPFLNFFETVGNDDPSACAAALQSGKRVIIEDVLTNEVFVGQPSQKILLDEDVRAVISVPLISSKRHTVGMLSIHFQQSHKPQSRELHFMNLLTRQAADFLERTQISDALSESDQRSRRLASIVEFSDDAIISKNLDGVITSWNKGAERVFGYTAEEAIGQPITIAIPRDRRDEECDILARISRGEHIEHFETIRQRKDGSFIPVSLTISPLKNAEGKIVGASKIARDITEQKRNQERIATLAWEAEHRSKNLLANVLATVTLSQADTPEGLKQAIEGRIRALANVHSLFAGTRWIGAELSTIATQELAPYSEKTEARVQIDGPQLVLEPNAAQAIAVILHELATNAAKYGALSVADGRVDLKWWHEPNGELNLHWTETGGPAVRKPTRRGLGRRIVERLVAEQKGKARFDWLAKGLACEITLLTLAR
jgi:PAS domain S-box-containing protein